jgi:hypothetical protein
LPDIGWDVGLRGGAVQFGARIAADSAAGERAMSERRRVYTGGCFCGAVRYEVTGPPLNVRVCHCRLCQRTTGAPMFARAVFSRDGFVATGALGRVQTSARQLRTHCQTCGGRLFCEPIDEPNVIAVALPTLDEPDALRPTMHIWTSVKARWVSLDDGLPQYPEGAPPGT